MRGLINVIPSILYVLIAIISVKMAVKNFSAVKYLPFHEQASGKPWDEIEPSLKLVILSLLRIVGLAFLIVAILLLAYPFITYFSEESFSGYLIPGIALLFCTGLFTINYSLYRHTGADTPWKGSLLAMAMIIAGIIISIFDYQELG